MSQSQKVDSCFVNPVDPTAASWYLVLCSSFSYRIVQIVPFVFRIPHHLDVVAVVDGGRVWTFIVEAFLLFCITMMITFFKATTIFFRNYFSPRHQVLSLSNVGKKTRVKGASRMQFIFTFLQIKVCGLRMLHRPSDVAKR